MLRLKTNTFELMGSQYFNMSKGFIISDGREKTYFLNLCYHIDRILYMYMISLKNPSEVREYSVLTMGQKYMAKVGAEDDDFIKIAGIPEFFACNDIETLNFTVEFL